MLDDSQERRIAQGLRDGDMSAWHALYDAYAERVWRSVARLLGPHPDDVADVVQETMMLAARSARTYDSARGKLWPWLWTIAHRHVALHLRKKICRDRLARAVARLAATESPMSPVDAAATAELAVVVRDVLAELSADHALLLTARYLEGETVAQIAEREKSTEVAVRSMLARARQAFRQVFERTIKDEPHAITRFPS